MPPDRRKTILAEQCILPSDADTSRRNPSLVPRLKGLVKPSGTKLLSARRVRGFIGNAQFCPSVHSEGSRRKSRSGHCAEATGARWRRRRADLGGRFVE